jgi:hypothetical protein
MAVGASNIIQAKARWLQASLVALVVSVAWLAAGALRS